MMISNVKEGITLTNNVVINDVNDLVRYLFAKFGELSPLKVQKGLYFLYAYYGANYGQQEQEGVLEQDFNLPPNLFNARFEAWTYGPVIREVYDNFKRDEFTTNKISLEEAQEIFNGHNEAKLFVDELFDQINKVSDFSLVDRSHEDNSWIEAYNRGKSSLIDNNKIISEYKENHIG